jgi:hypothetical protein
MTMMTNGMMALTNSREGGHVMSHRPASVSIANRTSAERADFQREKTQHHKKSTHTIRTIIFLCLKLHSHEAGRQADRGSPVVDEKGFERGAPHRFSQRQVHTSICKHLPHR